MYIHFAPVKPVTLQGLSRMYIHTYTHTWVCIYIRDRPCNLTGFTGAKFLQHN